jgi:hypothetical protein
MTRSLQRRSGPAPLDLIEEAVHLLRRTEAGIWFCYFTGTVPFVLALLYFWTDMSRGAFADRRCLGGALGLALLFVWMRAWQAVFAVKLREQRAHHSNSAWTFRRWWRVALIQAAIQPTALLVVPALVIFLPWTLAFYQNATALADDAKGGLLTTCRKAARMTVLWSGHNIVTWLTLAAFGFIVFLNVLVSLLVLPSLTKMLLGWESVFTFSGWAAFNTTLLAITLGISYLALDPLFRAVCMLRCYYGESQTTGEDLRVELRSLAMSRGTVAALALVMTLVCTPLHSAESPSPTTAVPEVGKLDQALDQVLNRTEYNWRLPRERSPEVAPDEGWFTRQMRKIEEGLQEAGRWVVGKAKSALEWLEKTLRPKSRSQRSFPSVLAWMTLTQLLMYLLLAVVLCVLAVLLLRAWQRRLRHAAVNAEAVTAVPDLRDENVGADQLPEDGWLQLARDMMSQGELRLALRALYLSSLAHLAERELVKLEKFKSNRDYEREVRRRARAHQGLPEAFADNVFVFDRAWYGLHVVTSEMLARFEQNFQRIKAA